MISRDAEQRIVQAGEYVLGTLNADETRIFNDALDVDPDLKQLVIEWQEEFQPLADREAPVEPPARVWRRLSRSIQHEVERGRFNHRRSHQDIRRQPDRERTGWQIFGSLATAAAVILGFMLVYERQKPASSVYEALAVISNDEKTPLWIVDISQQNQELRIISIAVPEIGDDRDHQLWLVKPDNAGVISLGLLPKVSNTSIVMDVEGIERDAVALAVSLEPSGGSKQEGPSGPVLFQGPVNTFRTDL